MIKFGMTVADMIAQLTRGFTKQTGRIPSGLEKIKIQQEAIQRSKDMNKVLDMKGNPIDPAKPIMGGEQSKNLSGELTSVPNRPGQSGLSYETRNKEAIQRLKDKMKKDPPEELAYGGVAGLLGERTGFMAGGLGRRGFLKMLAGAGAGIAGVKTGLFGLGKKTAVKEAVKQTAGSGMPPPHFFKLVEKIKSLGKDATPKYGTQPGEKVTAYKDYTLSEEINSGRTTIQRSKQSEIDYYDEMLMEDVYMSHTSGKSQMDETTKGKIPLDEYVEDTSYMRTSGPQKGDIVDTVDGVPDDLLEEVGEAAVKKADGGRIGYAAGKGVTSLLNLVKKKFGKKSITTADKIKTPQKTLDRDMFKKADDRLNDKREMTEDEYQDFADEIGENIEAYDFDGTVGDANRIRKDIKDYEEEMFTQYKMGKLDPVAGDKSPARKRFLEKKFEEMEDSGDPQLMTRDEIEELTSFDLGTEMDDFVLSSAEKKGKKLADSMSDAEIDLRDEFPGIEDRLIKQILTDNNPQRVAEVKQTMREALEMQNKGISVDEIIQTFKGTTRTKQASGGRIGLLAGGGVLKKLIMNLAKEKGMSGSEVLKVMNYKSLPSKIKNLMTKEEFTAMKDQRLEGVEIWRDLMASQQEMTKNIDAGKNTPAAELFEMLEKTSPGYKTVPRNISDADMLQMEQMIKNMKTKDNRQLNAKGGLANLLGE